MAVPKPLGQTGHYTLNVPIEPDQGEKMTVFQVSFHLSYSGSYLFKPTVLVPTDNFAVQLPKAMSFTPGDGASFQPIPQDPAVQTFLLKNALPGKMLDFTVSGTGAMPRENQGTQSGENAGAGGQAAPSAQPGGGIGEPINTPDPLTKYKWWILGGLGLLLATAAAFLLRKPPGAIAGAPGTYAVPTPTSAEGAFAAVSLGARNSALLNVLKEELFALESDKLSGTIGAEEYAEQKAALETVLKRALSKK
jgi:hypothetical protein